MFRAWFAMTRLDECDAISGALVVSIASKNVLSATCEMSTITPSRFISRTTSLPKAVRPLWAALSVDESGQLLFL
jgi:hypothetical protein